MTVETKEEKVEDKEVEKEEELEKEKEEVETPTLSEAEVQAQGLGWQTKEAWLADGKPEDEWTPAKHFLKFGEVKKQIVAKDKQLQKQDKIIKLMKNHHLNVRQAAYDEAVRILKAEREAALKDNDLVKAEQLRDRLDETKESFTKAKALPSEVEQELREADTTQSPPPEFFAFLERNPWYITDTNKQDEMSQEADKLGIAEVQYAQSHKLSVDLADVYKTVEKKIRKLYSEKFSTPRSPQSEGPQKTNKSTPSAVKLSEDELNVAKMFGLTVEQYSKQQAKYKGR